MLVRTYWKSSSSRFIIDRLVNREIDIRNLASEEVGTVIIAVILPQEVIVLGHKLVLVLVDFVAQIGYPLGLHAH